VERCVEEVARTREERLDLSRIPLDDGQTYAAIQRAETTGVFQIESRAQMQMLPRTLPRNLDDLTVQVALVRPGPIQGGAIHPYSERFIEGAIGQGASRAVAESVFAQIEGFSGFGFPKAHSAAFALLAYQSAWLREHRAPEFLASLLNEQPMGFYPPDALV